MRTVHFLILLVALTLVVDVDAGWKFWKKKKDDDTSTTEAALSSSTVASTTAKSLPTQKPTAPTINKGIAAAADPALIIGVDKTGDNIRDSAKNPSRKPAPGTEVGLDIGLPKPANPSLGGGSGQGYREWAADLTGVGDPGKPRPKIPEQGPALTAGGQPPQGPAGKPLTPGNTTPKTPLSTPVSKPSLPQPGKTQDFPPLSPTSSGGGSPPASPGSKSYAEITGGSNSRPGSPTLAPKPGSPTPAPRPGSPTPAPKVAAPNPTRDGQRPFEYPQPGTTGGQSGRPSISTGAAGATAAGAAAAGAAAAGAAAASTGYSSNPKYSKGKSVTDEDLEKLSEALFIKDVNNANKYIELNLQKQTSGSNPKDEAPEPLLRVKPEALQIPTIQKILSIYDNYKLDTRENEYISPAQRQEESLLIDTFLSTSVLSQAMRFLADKGFVKKDYYEYKDTLRSMWFNLYSRGEGKIGSTGFEHVFLAEMKQGNEVSGLHNWIYFNAQEQNKRLNYLGYIKKVDLGNKAAIVKAHVNFNGVDKPVTDLFVGTSPELEMALYTVCFFARPDAQCPVSLGGTKFNIITHKFRYRGRDLIGSAYPDL